MSEKIKVMVIGCGVISRHWFDYTIARPDCEIVAVVDINLEAAKRETEARNIHCPLFTDFEEALEKTKPDLVYDISYVTTHRKITTTCLKAGCSVMTEKPMTIDRESAEEILKTAKETGKFYAVMQNRRYQKPMQALRELVHSGKLGHIWMVCGEIFVGADLKSIRNTLPYPMLQDNAIHTLDGARFITGQDAVSVYCNSYNPIDSKYKGDAAGTCIYEMTDGSTFVYNCIMGVEGCRTPWESQWRIIGSKGSAVWSGRRDEAPYMEFRNAEGTGFDRFEVESDWNGQNQHFGCLDEMFDAYMNGRKSETDGEDNYKSISMVFSAIESAQCGQKVPVR